VTVTVRVHPLTANAAASTAAATAAVVLMTPPELSCCLVGRPGSPARCPCPPPHRGRVRPADPTVPGDIGDASTDPNFVAKGAVAWLKVTATATQAGPTGGETLTKTTFIQRLNTSGGLAPTTGCSTTGDLGHQAFVPYKADYFFYKADQE